MPRIPEYEAPNLALPTADRAVEARSQAGRRVSAMYEDAGGSIRESGRMITQTGARAADVMKDLGRIAENQIAHREVSQGAADFAKLQDGIQREWDATVKNADPNDPTVAQQFLEERVRPQIEQFTNKGFLSERGRAWAESHGISLQQHMWQKTAADMSTMAGLAVKLNAEQTVNRLSSTVRQDPSSLDFALRTAESSIGGVVETSPTLTPAAAAQARGALTLHAKEKIVLSYLQGVAEKNPDEAVKIVESGKYADFIDGQAAKQILAEVKRQKTADRVDENYRRHNAELERKQASDEAEGQWLKAIYSDDPAEKLRVSPRAIVNDDRLSNQTKEKMIGIVEREMKPETSARVSADTSRQLFERIYLPTGDPNKITDIGPITQARIDGKLSKADYKELREEITLARTPEGDRLGTARTEFFKRYSATIDTAMDLGGHSALGSQKIYEAEMEARRRETQLREKGLSPHLLYDPASEHFFGKPATLSRYQVSMKEAMDYQKALRDAKPSINLTAPGTTVTGMEIMDIPAGMSPAQAMKNFKPGVRVRLPDGRIGTVPGGQ